MFDCKGPNKSALHMMQTNRKKVISHSKYDSVPRFIIPEGRDLYHNYTLTIGSND